MSEFTKSIKGLDFENTINTNSLVLVDFWAPWCAPCRNFGVTYEQVAKKYPEIFFAKVNIEEEPEIAETFNIHSIPHLMVIKEGIVIYSEGGSMPESALTELVQQAVAADVSTIRAELENQNEGQSESK